MKADAIKLIFTYLIALAILIGTYYALVLSPFVVDDDVKLWLTGAAGAAIGFVFGEQIAMRTARQSESAGKQGAEQALSAPPPTSTMTATATPEGMTTVTSTPAVNGEELPTPGPTVAG